MPLDSYIEERHGEREPGMERLPHTVHDFLEVADERQHGEHRLHQQAVLPLAALTHFEIARIALRGMEAGVTQDNHAPIDVLNQPLKRLVRHMRRGTIPPHHQAILIQPQAEFAAHNPAMIGEAFAADLLRAAAFAPGVDPLHTVGVDDPEHGRGGQEGLRPVVMGCEETKEPRPLGQAGKQRPIVARQPPRERPVPPTLVGRRKARYLLKQGTSPHAPRLERWWWS